MVKEKSSLQSVVPTVNGHFAGESAATVALSRNDVAEQVLQNFWTTMQ